jgi:hypothetical protein
VVSRSCSGSDCPARSPPPSSTTLLDKRGDRRSLCRHAGIDCGADCGDECGRRDRRRHKAHDKGLGGLPSADDIPGVGQLTALAFVAAIDDPSRIRRSRDVGAYLGLVPRRYQSGEVDYIGSISKCGDRRVRTLLYEAANVMLTRYKGQLKLKDWAFAIAKRSTMRKARVALAHRLAIIINGPRHEPVRLNQPAFGGESGAVVKWSPV